MPKKLKRKTLVKTFLTSKQARKDQKTVDWYRARLAHWQKFARRRKLIPEDVVTADLDKFFGKMKTDGFKFSTRRGTLVALSAFFKWLVKHKYIKQNPFAEFEPLEKERDVTSPIALNTAQRMIKAAEQDNAPYGCRDAAIMRLLLTTGARREEIAGLKLENLNLDNSSLTLCGKYNNRRPAFLIPNTLAALRMWLDIRPVTPDQAVFVTLHPDKIGMYHQMQPKAINELLSKWRNRAGLPPVSVSPHKWRHRFATELALGRDPFHLQMLMGHEDITTTSIYVDRQPDVLRNLVLQYAPDVELPDRT